MSYYSGAKTENEATSPSSLYFSPFNSVAGKDQAAFEDDLVALIGHGANHPQQQQQQQQQQHGDYVGHGQNDGWRPPVHDIFGTFPSSSYALQQQQQQQQHQQQQHQHHDGPASFASYHHHHHHQQQQQQDHFSPPHHHALPSPAPTDSTSVSFANPPPPSSMNHRQSLSRTSVTSRSRSRSNQPRSTRGTQAAANAAALKSPSPGATGTSNSRPIPISGNLPPLGPLPHIPPSSALHGLAQSLPHSHWSAYLTNANGQSANGSALPSTGQHQPVPTPGTPGYLPTPDSYSSFASHGLGMAHSMGAVSTLSTSPPAAGTPKETSPQAHHDDPASKQAQLASEKRRRRRESHNAVERRRRDNINERISELATLIPEVMLDPSAGGAPPTLGQALFAISSSGQSGNGSTVVAEEGSPGADGQGILGEDGDEKGPMKANKGMILKKSVEYIRYLQQLVTAQANRNSELEAQLAHVRHNHNPTVNTSGVPDFGSGGMFDDMLLASPGDMQMGVGGLYDGPGSAVGPGHGIGVGSGSTESDEDVRSGGGAAEEEERGRARTRVVVKTEDVTME